VRAAGSSPKSPARGWVEVSMCFGGRRSQRASMPPSRALSSWSAGRRGSGRWRKRHSHAAKKRTLSPRGELRAANESVRSCQDATRGTGAPWTWLPYAESVNRSLLGGNAAPAAAPPSSAPRRRRRSGAEVLQLTKMRPDLLPPECFGPFQSSERLRRQPCLHAEDHDLIQPHAGGAERGLEVGLRGLRRPRSVGAATARAVGEDRGRSWPAPCAEN
jgi:hypothetical protein